MLSSNCVYICYVVGFGWEGHEKKPENKQIE